MVTFHSRLFMSNYYDLQFYLSRLSVFLTAFTAYGYLYSL